MASNQFEEAAKAAGLPTTESELKGLWQAELEAQGALLANGVNIENESELSPFYRLMSAIMVKPAYQIISYLTSSLLPNLFLRYATGAYLDDLAWSVGTERYPASKAQGLITFTRTDTSLELIIPQGIRIQALEIDNYIYEMVTLAEATMATGQASIAVLCEAAETGAAYNLGDGEYNILIDAVSGIDTVSNETGWLSTPGKDIELDEDLRTRIRNLWLKPTGWHVDDAYRAIIAEAGNLSADQVYFDHNSPRGAYAVDAYILLDSGVAGAELLTTINDHINSAGHHGHNDDVLAYAMPTTPVDVTAVITPVDNLTQAETDALLADVEEIIDAAFRANLNYPNVTRAKPFSTFSFSRLAYEMHSELKNLYSISFTLPTTDLQLNMEVPVPGTLTLSLA